MKGTGVLAGYVGLSALANSAAAQTNQVPYGRSAHELPGRIEAENFDEGGEGVVYHDTDSRNRGGAYRDTGVDIEPTRDDTGQYNVGYITDGEWLEWTINAPSGTYDIDLRVAAPSNAGGDLTLSLGGAELGTATITETGGWQSWTTVTISDVTIPKTTSGVLRADFSTNELYAFNLNWIKLSQSDSDESDSDSTMTSIYTNTIDTDDPRIIVCETAQEIHDAIAALNGDEGDEPDTVKGIIQLVQKRYEFDQPITPPWRGIYIRGPHWNQLAGKDYGDWINCELDFSTLALDPSHSDANDPEAWPAAIDGAGKEQASSFGLEGVRIVANGRMHGARFGSRTAIDGSTAQTSVGSVTMRGVWISCDLGSAVRHNGTQDFTHEGVAFGGGVQARDGSGNLLWETAVLETRDAANGDGVQGWFSGEISTNNIGIDHRSHRLFIQSGKGVRTRLNMGREPDADTSGVTFVRQIPRPLLYTEANTYLSETFFSTLKNADNSYAIETQRGGAINADFIRIYLMPNGAIKLGSRKQCTLRNVFCARIGGNALVIDGTVPEVHGCSFGTEEEVNPGLDAIRFESGARESTLGRPVWFGMAIPKAGRNGIVVDRNAGVDPVIFGAQFDSVAIAGRKVSDPAGKLTLEYPSNYP